jgi:hypothetical protein
MSLLAWVLLVFYAIGLFCIVGNVVRWIRDGEP